MQVKSEESIDVSSDSDSTSDSDSDILFEGRDSPPSQQGPGSRRQAGGDRGYSDLKRSLESPSPQKGARSSGHGRQKPGADFISIDSSPSSHSRASSISSQGRPSQAAGADFISLDSPSPQARPGPGPNQRQQQQQQSSSADFLSFNATSSSYSQPIPVRCAPEAWPTPQQARSMPGAHPHAMDSPAGRGPMDLPGGRGRMLDSQVQQQQQQRGGPQALMGLPFSLQAYGQQPQHAGVMAGESCVSWFLLSLYSK